MLYCCLLSVQSTQYACPIPMYIYLPLKHDVVKIYSESSEAPVGCMLVADGDLVQWLLSGGGGDCRRLDHLTANETSLQNVTSNRFVTDSLLAAFYPQ